MYLCQIIKKQISWIKIQVLDNISNNHLDNFFLEYIDDVGNKETIPLKKLN